MSPEPETTVYVVDDDPDMCRSVDWLLSSIGITTVTCHSGDEFLAAYDGQRPACIVLDVRMPRMSGPRLQEKLNEFAPHVAIIFVSAHGDIRMSVSTMQAGALDFLEKPYDPQRLLDGVQAGIEVAERKFADHRAREAVQSRIGLLTPRERQILALVIEGLPSQNIARRLGMSVKTVDVHRARIKGKTGADSISTLMRDVLRYEVDVSGEETEPRPGLSAPSAPPRAPEARRNRRRVGPWCTRRGMTCPLERCSAPASRCPSLIA